MKRREFLGYSLWGGGIAVAAVLNFTILGVRKQRQRVAGPLLRMEEPPGTPDRDVRALAFSLNGDQLVSVTADRKMSLWNSENEKIVFSGQSPHGGGANGVSLFNDGGWLATVSDEPYLSIWQSVAQNDEAKLIRLYSTPNALAFAPTLGGVLMNQHRLVVAQRDRTIRVFERCEGDAHLSGQYSGVISETVPSSQEDFVETRVLQQKYGDASAVVFSPNGDYLVASLGGNYLQTWSVERDWSEGTISSDTDSPLHATAFSQDSRLLAAGAEDGTIVIWDWRSRNQIARLKGFGSPVADLLFFGANNWIMAAFADGVHRVWSGRNEDQGVVVGECPGRHVSLSRSSDGQRVASAWGADVKFWKSAEIMASM